MLAAYPNCTPVFCLKSITSVLEAWSTISGKPSSLASMAFNSRHIDGQRAITRASFHYVLAGCSVPR